MRQKRHFIRVGLGLGLAFALLSSLSGPFRSVANHPTHPGSPEPFFEVAVYTDPTAFEAAISEMGAPTVADFEDIDASPVNNTYVGRDEFDGDHYLSLGITFTNTNDYPLYVAPGGLFWNASNSLSVGRFPWDPAPRAFNHDDDIRVAFDHPCVAAGLALVDAGEGGDYVEFLTGDGSVLSAPAFPADFTSYRAFVGLVSTYTAIAAINVVEAAYDGNDVNYDDVICVPWVYHVFLPEVKR
jgi:hypothetical protein